ncbi:MAG: NAD(P)/FAD-dependent oxidoreductase [Halioglobus sp.]|nr:NAD(P)/FAD-dependent oxidoreductase [Halioglobus sp.]
MPDSSAPRIAVIGAGPAGIAAGYELLQQGFTDFTIFEKSDAAGGTWHLHSYPGLACDLWAHFYTFSYRPNPDWSANFVDQPEIEAYLQRCASEFGLDSHFVFNTRIDRCVFTADKCWELTTDKGETQTFDAVINAMGGQHTAIYPEVPGRDSFEGDQWHSTHWNHNIDLAGKRVAIVGSAAAAVQIVPKVAGIAGHLTVLQRTPNWIMPRNWKAYSPRMLALFRRFPALTRVWRWGQGLLMGVVLEGVTLGHKRMEQFESRVHKFIESAIDDPELRRAVTPDTRYGCKRGLVSDEFYPTLNRDDVELVAEGLTAVRAQGITTASGRDIDVDVIIYCTGYQVMDFDRIDVRGQNGKVLGDVMNAAPQAYLGIAAPDFPNYFFAAGPNGIPINTSYFTSVERNVKTAVNLLAQMRSEGVKAIAVKPEVSAAYNAQLAPAFATYSWGHSSCNSYYRRDDGSSPFLYPGGFKDYAALHEACGLADFEPA